MSKTKYNLKDVDTIENDMSQLLDELSKKPSELDNDYWNKMKRQLEEVKDLYNIYKDKPDKIESVARSFEREINNLQTLINEQEKSIDLVVKKIQEEAQVIDDSSIKTQIKIQEGLRKRKLSQIPQLDIKIEWQDDLRKSVKINLSLGSQDGIILPHDPDDPDGLTYIETYGKGIYYTESAKFATEYFLDSLINIVAKDHEISKNNMVVRLYGYADGHSISSSIPYENECGIVFSYPSYNLNSNKAETINLSDDKISNNNELAYFRAFCVLDLIKSSLRVEEVELFTKTFQTKGETYRKIEIEVIMDGINQKMFEYLKDRADDKLRGIFASNSLLSNEK